MTTKPMTAPLQLDPAANGPKIKTALPGPNARRGARQTTRNIFRRRIPVPYPLVAKSGRGIVITMSTANEFYDFSAGIAVTSTGHCHPEVVALCRNRRRTDSTCRHRFYYEELWSRWRSDFRRSHPMPGRTKFTTVTPARRRSSARSRLARYHTKRQNIIAFFGRVSWTHHGRVVADRLETAATGRRFGRSCRESPTFVIPMFIAAARAARRMLDRFCAWLRTLHREKLFKTTLPPEESGRDLCGAGAGRRRLRGRADYFHCKSCGASCESSRILLVLDEVQSGVGRTGSVGRGAQPRRAGQLLHRQGNCIRHASRHHR